MTEELRIIITAETDRLRQGVNDARQEVENLSSRGKENFKKFSDAAKTASDKVKSVMKVAAVSIAGAATALLALGPATEEFRVNMAKLTAGFEQAGMTADDAKGIYRELFAVIGDSDQATESANNIALLAKSEEEAARWAELASGVVGTFHDTLQPEAFYEAANETLKLGEATGAYAQMLEQTGVMSVEEFNKKLAECKTEQEKNAFMLSVSEKAMGEAGASYDEATEKIQKQREAQLKLQESLAKVGEAVTPVVTALASFLGDVLAKIEPYITAFAEKYGPTIKEILDEVGKAIGAVINFIVENWDIIVTIATVVGAIAAAILLVNGAITAYNTVMAIANAVMAASPITWIVAGIVALVAAIILCIVYWDEIKNAAGHAIEFIKDVWNNVASWFNEKIIQPIKDFFTGLWTTITDAADGALSKVKEIWQTVKDWFNDTIIQPVSNFFTGMWNGLKNGAKNAWEGIKKTFSTVASFFKNIFSKAWEGVRNVFSVGGKIFDGIKDGISNVFKTIVNKLIDGINRVIAIPFKAINKVLKKIKNINILGVEPFTWVNTFDIPELPKLARGGIVDSATIAMVGEQGKEAIVPLENNTEWLDKLAAKINAPANSRPMKVVLNVDGKAFAETSLSAINDYTKQTGSLKLNLM